jgi:hypothetical protein
VTIDTHDLEEHLVDSRLAGAVATTPRQTVNNCAKLVAGHEQYTFGLTDWHAATLVDAVDAVRTLCGGDPGGAADPGSSGWIEPAATLHAVAVHRERLAASARARATVLLGTGHPGGLLGHYTAIGRAFQAHGCRLLAPLDDVILGYTDEGRRRGIRFVDGVACAFDGASLRHSHRSDYMEAILDEVDGHRVDLVLGDHGFAGAAIERGIPTLSIADVNDPALALAQARGRTDAVLPIDDNLSPRSFIPVTTAMLAWT